MEDIFRENIAKNKVSKIVKINNYLDTRPQLFSCT